MTKAFFYCRYESLVLPWPSSIEIIIYAKQSYFYFTFTVQVLDIIVFICSVIPYWRGEGWVGFVAMTACLTTIVLFFLYLFGLMGRAPGWMVMVVSIHFIVSRYSLGGSTVFTWWQHCIHLVAALYSLGGSTVFTWWQHCIHLVAAL